MKNDFYEYACPSNRMTREQYEANKSKTKKGDLIGNGAIFFVLLLFSLPMALSETLAWCIVSACYVTLLIVNKAKDNDPYSSFFLFFGASTAYLGIVLSYLIIDGAYKRYGYSCWRLLILLSVVLILCYECSVFFNILFFNQQNIICI